jgi:hypothetical protein
MTSLKYGRTFAVAFALVGVAACSDNPASPLSGGRTPNPDVQRAIDAPAAAPVRAPHASLSASVAGPTNPSDTLAVSFQVGPEGGVFPLGRHWIAFPENSVCDMSQTQYGEAFWNELCPIATEPVTINAIVFADSAGHPHVEFDQHLRFDPTKQVIMHMSFDYREGDVAPDILWRRQNDASVVEEGEIDPAMITREGDSWLVYRRVKHFSGYVLITGYVRLDSSGDGSSGSLGIDLGFRRATSLPSPRPLQSGHVVATGREEQK